MTMLITSKPTQFQLRLPFSPSTKRTTFNPRRTIILNNNNNNNDYTASMRVKKDLHRKLYPGETTGITEEMRFVALRLRNTTVSTPQDDKDPLPHTWHPSMEGFIRFLVDNQLLFATLERILHHSDNVSFAYLRKTGLERSERIKKDLEWFKEQGAEIPDPSSPGITYAKYLEELAETSTPMFLTHFYNIHFSHISAGQVITNQVSEKLLEGKELEFCKWEGDVQELLKDVREKLNVLSEHWSRDVKNKCLVETRKSFRFLGKIVRLIIL